MNSPNRLWTITAIVCDPDPVDPFMNGNYFMLIAKSSNSDIEEHNKRLVADGWRVASVKCRPYDEYADDFMNEITDNQGNQRVVDDKRVVHHARNIDKEA